MRQRETRIEKLGLPMPRPKLLWRMLTCPGVSMDLPMPQKPRGIHVACYGPSLHKTWHRMIGQDVISVSGAHDFLVERGIVPQYHLEIDPRPHKVGLINRPQRDTIYIIATVCHRNMFERLRGYDVRKIHAIFGSWFGAQVLTHFVNHAPILTGGNNVGTRAVPLARSMGYRQIHIHGMDLCLSDGERWAGPHTSTEKVRTFGRIVGSKAYQTTSVMHEASDFMLRYFAKTPECRFAVYGDGMLAALIEESRNQQIVPLQWYSYGGDRHAANAA